MGAEAARLSRGAGYPVTGGSGAPGSGAGSSGVPGGAEGTPVNFPNFCRREWEAPAWTLLHQCGLDKWKDGHAG